MMSDLAAVLEEHLAAPFPSAVRRGEDYGSVCAVTIDADICGWARRAGSLPPGARMPLARAADRLRSSLPDFPAAGRPYYERLLVIADLALAE
ncbi:hypothetical protein [Amycolatopsis sp. cmx-8-4]|uniref:hypothetical protein n=1 Tax=Amycolatopsis sp. cmx-8-4 TaxID=2790947 RepID=UPI00397E19E6